MKKYLPLLFCVIVLNACVDSNSIPSSVTVQGAVVALTANDRKALAVAQSVENSLPIVKASAESGLELAFSVDPSLGTAYGAQMWSVSHGVTSAMLTKESLETGHLPTPDNLKTTLLSFTDARTANEASTITAQVDNFQSLYALAYQKLQAAIGTTNNAYVIAQLNQAGDDLLLALATAVGDATQRYAPSSGLSDFIDFRRLRFI